MSVLEFLTGFINVFENPLWNWIFGGVLVTVSGSIAYAIGGELDYSGKIGWFLWLITAILVYTVIACVIRAVMWLIALPWWIWVIAGAIVVMAIVLIIVLKYRLKSGETQ